MQNAKPPRRELTTEGARILRDAVLKQTAKDLLCYRSDEIPLLYTAWMLNRHELDWLFEGMPIDGKEFLKRIIDLRRKREQAHTMRTTQKLEEKKHDHE